VCHLTNKVTVSRQDSPTGLYGRAVSGVALLAKDWAIGFAPRLADGAAVQTECHLIYQAAH
jgi:hypothetical protein